MVISASCLLLLGAVRAAPKRSAVPSATALASMGLQERSLRVGALERKFLILPPSDPTRPARVLIVVHGGTQSMRRIFAPDVGATLGWPALARRENVLLIVPNATNAETGDPNSDDQTWNDLRQNVVRETKADDVGFISALVDWAHRTYRTDRSRTYVTGASNGGMMTFRLLMEVPHKFAAGAAFAAALPADASRVRRPTLTTPLMIANGTLDPLVKWKGGAIAGGRGEMQSVPDTMRWWVTANQANPNADPVLLLPNNDLNDKCIIEQQTYAAGNNGAPVVAITMRGGGHTIPSAKFPIPDNWLVRRFIGPVCRDIEGTDFIWTFLSAHHR